MNDLTELIKSVKKDSMVIRDFNMPEINFSTGETTARSRNFLEAVDDALLVQHVDFPTHIKGNCLDLVLSNIPEQIIEVSEAGRLGSSDPEMVSILVQVGQYLQATKKVKNWRKAKWDGMRKDMEKTDWNRELGGLTVDRMWIVLRRKVEATIKRHVPLKVVNCRGRPCWMTREIVAAIRKKKKLWQQVKRGGMTDEYREADKKVKRMIRNSKRKFEKKLAAPEGGNKRPFFAYIKRKTKSRPTIGPLKSKDKTMVADQEGMARILNDFFSSVFTEEDLSKIPKAADMETDSIEAFQITE
jgi:hypothetical protein